MKEQSNIVQKFCKIGVIKLIVIFVISIILSAFVALIAGGVTLEILAIEDLEEELFQLMESGLKSGNFAEREIAYIIGKIETAQSYILGVAITVFITMFPATMIFLWKKWSKEEE